MPNKKIGKKQEEHWPTAMESVEQSIKDLEGATVKHHGKEPREYIKTILEKLTNESSTTSMPDRSPA